MKEREKERNASSLSQQGHEIMGKSITRTYGKLQRRQKKWKKTYKKDKGTTPPPGKFRLVSVERESDLFV